MLNIGKDSNHLELMYFNIIKNDELDFIKETKWYVNEYMVEDK
jgi:hypothetical protein